eukprot:TRINITY_DN2317_c0_g1_i1.p1 TRINITY_DN2317_c0_g1~~TRINITY_DN2317_c0_g1_i1.p1  ORF type:complete len:259 (-),score=57.39 TRINITY_DN2317_c0_g1_i1:150-854(-)
MSEAVDAQFQFLQDAPSLLVKQSTRGACIEACCGCEFENSYSVFNPHAGSEKILKAREHSSCLSRCCCGSRRNFKMTIETPFEQEVLTLVRPFHGTRGCLFCCCFNYCFQVMRVYTGKDLPCEKTFLGYIRENYSFCHPLLVVHNANDDEIYRITGNCCSCCDYTMTIHDQEGHDVGQINKKWSGIGKELFLDSDNFFVVLPQRATPSEKALLLAATFFVDYLFFEKDEHPDQD